MTTPRKPGAKRGRQRTDFFADPDRFAVAFAFALRTLGVSENTAFLTVSVLTLGRQVGDRPATARRKRGVGVIPAGTMITFERIQRAGMVSASFANFASTLKKKSRRVSDPRAVIWLTATQFQIASKLRAACETGSNFEPWLASLFSASPELLPRDTGKAEVYDQRDREAITMTTLYGSLSLPRRAEPFMLSPRRPITVLIDQGEIAKLIQLTPEVLGASHERVVHELAEAIAGFIKERTA
jgi:hypothetical protein